MVGVHLADILRRGEPEIAAAHRPFALIPDRPGLTKDRRDGLRLRRPGAARCHRADCRRSKSKDEAPAIAFGNHFDLPLSRRGQVLSPLRHSLYIINVVTVTNVDNPARGRRGALQNRTPTGYSIERRVASCGGGI